MKIAINDKIYTEADGVISIYLTEQDKKNIENMHKDAKVYMIYNVDSVNTDEATAYIKNLREKYEE